MRSLHEALQHIHIQCQQFTYVSNEIVDEKFGKEYRADIEDELLHHYFIYIQDARPIVLAHEFGNYDIREVTEKIPNFQMTLSQLPEINYDSLLFALTLLRNWRDIDPIALIHESKKFERYPEFDDLLSPTYGYIVYKTQLEQLIARLSDNRNINPEQHRKGWNKKLHTTIDFLKTFRIRDQFSLTDLLIERTIEENHFVWSPNYRGAQLLYNHLLSLSSRM